MLLALFSLLIAAPATEPVGLSLAEAVSRAEAADTRFLLTELSEEAADLRAHEAFGRALPSLTLGATVVRNAQEIRVGEGSSARVVSPLIQPQGNAVGRVTLFRGSALPEAVAGYVSAAAEGAAQAEARDALRGDVAALYLALAEAQGLVEVLRRAEETAAELLRIAEARVAAETGIPLDVEQARAELLRSRAERAQALGAAAQVSALLALRCGLPPRTPLAARCEDCLLAPVASEDRLFELRTDLVGLDQSAQAAGIREVGRWLNLLPSLELLGNVRLAEPTLFNPNLVWWNAQLVFSWELFSGTADLWGALGQGVERRRAVAAVALAADEARAAVRQAEAGLAAARAELEAAAARAGAAVRALELAQARFREGLSSSFEVTEVARRRAEAEAAALRARYGIYRAVLGLRRALGLGPMEAA